MRSNLFGSTGPSKSGMRNRSENGGDEEMEDQLEKENEDELGILREKVAVIRSVALDIKDELKAHNEILDGMGDQFSTARGLLKNTMGRLNTMMQHGGSKHMCLLVLFVFLVFLALYWLLKTTR